MWRKLAFTVVAVASLSVIGLTAKPREAQAGCALDCTTCGGIFSGHMGRYPSTNAIAIYTDDDGVCNLFTSDCGSCLADHLSDGTDANTFAERIKNAPLSELATAIKGNANRMSVSRSRGLLAIRGTTCNPNGLAVVIFLSKDRAEALAKLGIGPIDPKELNTGLAS